MMLFFCARDGIITTATSKLANVLGEEADTLVGMQATYVYNKLVNAGYTVEEDEVGNEDDGVSQGADSTIGTETAPKIMLYMASKTSPSSPLSVASPSVTDISQFDPFAMVDRFSSAIQTAVVMAHERNGKIFHVNRACEQLFGYDKSELMGKNVNVLMPEGVAKHHDKYFTKIRSRTDESVTMLRGMKLEVMGRHKDGTEFPIFIQLNRGATNRSASDRYVAALIEDLRPAKQMEEERLEAEKKAAQAEGERETMRRFLRCTGHDMRTPVHSATFAAHLLMDRPLAQEESNQQLLNEIISSLESLNHVLSNIVDTSHPFSVMAAPCDLSSVIRQALHAARRRKVTTGEGAEVLEDLEETGWVVTDGSKVSRVCSNLISSFAKFTDGKGSITVKLNRDKPTGKTVIWVFSDNKVNVTQETLQEMALSNPMSLDHSLGDLGTGFELFSCHSIVEALGGNLILRVEENGGISAVFSVFAPSFDTTGLFHQQQPMFET